MGNNWQCPGHDDRTPSLSINPDIHRETREPIVLIHCHAGCSVDEILSALGLEPSDLFTGNGQRQERLFPVERFSPVRRSGWLALPPSVGTHFGVASTFGRLLVVDGTFRRVASTNETLAIVLSRKDRKALREALGIPDTSSQLRNEIMIWRQSNMAHVCGANALTLFVRPDEACPYCKASLSNDVSGVKASPTNDGRPNERHPAMTLPGTELHQPTAGSLKGCDGGEARAWGAYPELKALEWLGEDEERRGSSG